MYHPARRVFVPVQLPLWRRATWRGRSWSPGHWSAATSATLNSSRNSSAGQSHRSGRTQQNGAPRGEAGARGGNVGITVAFLSEQKLPEETELKSKVVRFSGCSFRYCGSRRRLSAGIGCHVSAGGRNADASKYRCCFRLATGNSQPGHTRGDRGR